MSLRLAGCPYWISTMAIRMYANFVQVDRCHTIGDTIKTIALILCHCTEGNYYNIIALEKGNGDFTFTTKTMNEIVK